MKTSAKLAGRLRRAKKRPFDGDPRADETRAAMLAARFEDEVEVMDLQASELACDVADAWADKRAKRPLWAVGFSKDAPSLVATLDRLELVTRPSAMRRVRP